jgi:hypothetical protein
MPAVDKCDDFSFYMAYLIWYFPRCLRFILLVSFYYQNDTSQTVGVDDAYILEIKPIET